MRRTVQVRIFRGEQQYVAECLDLPVVTEWAASQEKLTELVKSGTNYKRSL